MIDLLLCARILHITALHSVSFCLKSLSILVFFFSPTLYCYYTTQQIITVPSTTLIHYSSTINIILLLSVQASFP
ncbi:hypothetical protein BDC45DRAFT_515992 [Circinella umbellata]|nr:hypothetical protein BDC45DRAFT_515992 [Circinella umbellata]